MFLYIVLDVGTSEVKASKFSAKQDVTKLEVCVCVCVHVCELVCVYTFYLQYPIEYVSGTSP